VLRSPAPAGTCARIAARRRQRLAGEHIALKTGGVGRHCQPVLHRAGLSRMRDPEPAGPERRHAYDSPGGLIHLDIKKPGKCETTGHRIIGDPQQGKTRGAGWEQVHVCIDDHLN